MTARDELREYADRYGYSDHVNGLLDAYRAEVLAEAADVADGIGSRLKPWEGADGAYTAMTELRRMAIARNGTEETR